MKTRKKDAFSLFLTACILLSATQDAFAAVRIGLSANPADMRASPAISAGADTRQAPESAVIFSVGDEYADTLADAVAILKTKTSAENPALLAESIILHADYTISSEEDADALYGLRRHSFALDAYGAPIYSLLVLKDGVTLTLTTDIELERIRNARYLFCAESEGTSAALALDAGHIYLHECVADTMLWNLNIDMQRSYLIMEDNQGNGILGSLSAERSHIYINTHKKGHGFSGSIALLNATKMEVTNNDYAGIISTDFYLYNSEIRVSDNITEEYSRPDTLASDFTFDITGTHDFLMDHSKIAVESFASQSKGAGSIAIYAGSDGNKPLAGESVNLYVSNSSFIVGAESIIDESYMGDAKISMRDSGEPDGSLGDGSWTASAAPALLTVDKTVYDIYADDVITSRGDLLYSAVYLPVASLDESARLTFDGEVVPLDAALAQNADFPVSQALESGKTLKIFASAAYVASISGDASLTFSGKKTPDTVKTGTSWVVRDNDEATHITAQAGAGSYIAQAAIDGRPLNEAPNEPNSALHFIEVIAAEIEKPAKSSAQTILTLDSASYNIYADEFWNGSANTYLIYLPTASMQQEDIEKSLTLTPTGGKTYTIDLSTLPADTHTPVRLTDEDGTVFALYASAAYTVAISGLTEAASVSIGTDILTTNMQSGWVVRDSDEDTVITASPASGGQLSVFKVNGEVCTPPHTMPANTMLSTIEAVFIPPAPSSSSGKSSTAATYTITATAGQGGTVSPGTITITRGGSATIAVNPSTGYTIDTITVNGSTIGAVSAYTFTDVRTNQTLHATFKPMPSEPAPVEAGGFADVNAYDWFADAVAYVTELELFNGTTYSTFSPRMEMTREMFVTVLGRLAQSLDIPTAGYSAGFSDVRPGEYYTDYIAWATANNIVTGYDDTTFGVGAYITREQMSVMLIRFAEYAGLSLRLGSASSYIDTDQISGWASDAVAVASSTKLISGYSNGAFLPQNTATRAEVATIFMNLGKQLGNH